MDKSLPFFSLLFIFAMWEACAASVPTKSLFYGFDFGTSGVRCCLIDSARGIIHEDSILWTNIRPANSLISMTDSWETATDLLLESTPIAFRGDVKRICISGTSSSALVYDLKHGIVSRQPRMYDFNVLQESGASNFGSRAMTAIQSVCPTGSAANAPTSSLAKVLSWNFESPFLSSERLLHQSDFLIHHITSSSIATMGKYESDPKAGVVFSSDWHNSLKLGYDVHSLSYPEWMLNLLFEEGILESFLPAVVEPGRSITIVNDRLVDMGYSKDCSVVAGTTDSIAAFLASGADTPGQAVTSLGSTLVIKLLSEQPVEDSSRGIYSHRLGDRWLVGGASNVGCAILRKEEFSNTELAELSEKIDPLVNSVLCYYPLTKIGERFPKNDPKKEPVLDPKPLVNNEVCREQYLHGILQGISEVEREGYLALEELGATPVTEILTAGGGSNNIMWTKMRERILGVTTRRAPNVHAAYGDALLAAKYHVEKEGI